MSEVRRVSSKRKGQTPPGVRKAGAIDLGVDPNWGLFQLPNLEIVCRTVVLQCQW